MYIDLLQIQRSSFLKFLQNGIYQVFDNINPIIIANRKYVFFSKYYLLKIPSPMHFDSENSQVKTLPKLSTETIKIPEINTLLNESINLWKWFNRVETNGLNRLMTPKFNNYAAATNTRFEQIVCPCNDTVFLYKKTVSVARHKIKTYCHFSNKALACGSLKQIHYSNNAYSKIYATFKNYGPVAKNKNPYFKKSFYKQRQNNSEASKKKLPLLNSYKEFKSNSFESCFSMLNRIKANSLMKIPLIWIDFYKNIKLSAAFQKKENSQNFSYLEQNYTNPNDFVTENLLKIDAGLNLTYSSEFYIPVQIIDQISKKMYLRWLLLADLPIQTKRGHFIINGYPKTVIHQIVRSPGIRFKNQTSNLGSNQILADIISMRGSWMGIQIIYEKNLKAENFSEKRTTTEKIVRLAKTPTKTMNTITKNIVSKTNGDIGNFSVTNFPDASTLNPYLVKINDQNYQHVKNFRSHSNSLFDKRKLFYEQNSPKKLTSHAFTKRNTILAPTPISWKSSTLFHFSGQWINKKNVLPNCLKSAYNSKMLYSFKFSPEAFVQMNKISQSKKRLWPVSDKKQSKTSHKNYQYATSKLCDDTVFVYKNCVPSPRASNSSQSLKRDNYPVFPLNPTKESEKMNNALFIHFFISPSKNDKGENKKIKLYGLTFLDYLFDNPYFTYNNYVPSSLSSSFFPAYNYEIMNKFSPSYLLNTCNDLPFFNLSHNQEIIKGVAWDSLNRNKYYAATMQELWPKSKKIFVMQRLVKKYFKNREHFFTAKKQQQPAALLKRPTQELGTQFLYTKTVSSFFKNSILNMRRDYQNNFKSVAWRGKPLLFLNKNNLTRSFPKETPKKIDKSILMSPIPQLKSNSPRASIGKNGKFLRPWPGTNDNQNNRQPKSFKTISSNRLLASHVSILNTTNFRDILFERFMNAKFYDIGYMGRKRLNKKLRLNIPLQCTTLTPLDFLALFYKLFSLYNHFSSIQNYFPLTNPSLGEPLNGFANFSGSLETSNINRSLGSVTLRETKKKLLPIDPMSSPGTEKPSNDLISAIRKQTGSLDHLNQRHIRTSGEFLFLQFWRAILRFYQVLSLLSTRSNFIKSSYTYPGKTGRNFFSLSSLALNNWENSFDNIYHLKRTKQILLGNHFFSIGRKSKKTSDRKRAVKNTFHYRTEYYLPIIDNLNSILKTWGYPNFTSPKSLSWNYRFQLFSNGQTFTNSYNSFIDSRGLFSSPSYYGANKQPNQNKGVACKLYLHKNNVQQKCAPLFAKKKFLQRQSLNTILAKKEIIPTNYTHKLNITTTHGWSRIASTMGTSHTIGIANQVSGWYSNATNSSNETINISINRNDLTSIFFYSPSNQISNQIPRAYTLLKPAKKSIGVSQKILTATHLLQYPLYFTRTITNNRFSTVSWKRVRFDSKKMNGLKSRGKLVFSRICGGSLKNDDTIFVHKNCVPSSKPLPLINMTNFSKRNKSLDCTLPFENNLYKLSSGGSSAAALQKKDALFFDKLDARQFIPLKKNFPCKSTFLIKPVRNLTNNIRLAKMNFFFSTITSKTTELENPNIDDLYSKKLLYESKELRIFDAKERMRNLETKLFNGVFKEFFNLDPLSQDLDETNGLSEIIHKRRISALGKGGVTSKNAPLSIRSIHPSFYGRLCPIDSPEGDRVGLINSLTNYARISSIGYIATPFYRTRLYDNPEEYTQMIQEKSSNQLVTQSLPMRICAPLAFFGKIYQSSKLNINSFRSKKQIKNLSYPLSTEGGSEILATPLKSNMPINLPTIEQQLAFFERISNKSKKNPDSLKYSRRQLYETWLYQSRQLLFLGSTDSLPSGRHQKKNSKPLPFPPVGNKPLLTNRKRSNETVDKYYQRKVELLSFYDTHYMTPPIKLRENLINHGYKAWSFLIGYFDFIPFQGYAPITNFQFFSPGVGLIPFLEHDDGTRALMGANMQRQAVPLIKSCRPIVGTGLEKNVAASFIISSTHSGYVYYVSGKQSKQMLIRWQNSSSSMGYNKKTNVKKQSQPFIINTHWLPYRKSYKATCIQKKPAVLENSWIQKGDVLVNGTSSINGEISLGRNLFSIYMPWEGYNFEDAILISDKAAEDYTSIHIEEFSVKISKNEQVSSIIKPYSWVNYGTALVSKKRKHENSFIMNRLLFGMSSKGSQKLKLDSDSDDLFAKQSMMNPSILQNKKEQSYSPESSSSDYIDTSTSWLDSNSMSNSIQPLSSTPFFLQSFHSGWPDIFRSVENAKNPATPIQKPYTHFLKNHEIAPGHLINNESNMEKIHELFKDHTTLKSSLKKGRGLEFKLSNSHIIRPLLENSPRASDLLVPFSLVLYPNRTFYDLNKTISNWIPYSVSKFIEKSDSNLDRIHKFRYRNIQKQKVFEKALYSSDTSNDNKNSLLTNKRPWPGTNHFEIDTSYRTGESISGWVLSVKAHLNRSLSKKSQQNSRKIALYPPKNQNIMRQLVGNFQTKTSAWFERILTPVDYFNDFSNKAKLSLFSTNKIYKNTENLSILSKSGNVSIFPYPLFTESGHIPSGILATPNYFQTSQSNKKLCAALRQNNQLVLTLDKSLENPFYQHVHNYTKKNKSSLRLLKKNNTLLFDEINAPGLNAKLKSPSLSSIKNNDTSNQEKTDNIYVYIAVAKPLQVGDKMSGRHGNKGIISKILPFYDMPYLVDGTPIDIILNPLGVPSRMNVGQIYESLLGLTGFYKQEYYRIPPFDENYSDQFSRNFVYWKLNELNQLHQFGPCVQKTIESSSKEGCGALFLSKTKYKWQKVFFRKNIAYRIFKLFSLYLFSLQSQSIKQFNYPQTRALRLRLFMRYFKRNQSFIFQNEANLINFLQKQKIQIIHCSSIEKIRRSKKQNNHVVPIFINWNNSLLKQWPINAMFSSPAMNTLFTNSVSMQIFVQDKKNAMTQFLFTKTVSPAPGRQIPSTYQTKLILGSIIIGEKSPSSTGATPSPCGSNPRVLRNNRVCGGSSKNNKNNSLELKNYALLFDKYTNFKPFQKILKVTNFNFTPKNAEKMGLNPYFPGKMRLLNGMSGETFYRPIIVGKSYMLKLIHLVHNKIHARATGPYALITQQPLKGKRNQGGQRMGEMEIWALYGFGSSSILYEMLTIKSDDPVGRERILREIAGLQSPKNIAFKTPFSNHDSVQMLQEYESYSKNENYGQEITNNDPFSKGIAESFRVLVMNLRALCIDMQVFKDLSSRQS